MSCICAPSLDLLRTEFDVAHPGRSTASDGCCSSQQHQIQNPNSDHDDGNARDFTNDAARGMRSAEWAEEIKNDPRVKYIIRDRRIYNADVADYWREYTGSNPHDKHGHVSIHPWSRDDLRPWLIDDTEEFTVMDDATRKYLDAQFRAVTRRQRRARMTQLAQGRVLAKIVRGQKATSEELADLDADVDEILAELREDGD